MELNELSDPSNDACDVSYVDLGIEDDVFLIRFGENAAAPKSYPGA
jgi:hypothetical protein